MRRPQGPWQQSRMRLAMGPLSRRPHPFPPSSCSPISSLFQNQEQRIEQLCEPWRSRKIAASEAEGRRPGPQQLAPASLSFCQLLAELPFSNQALRRPDWSSCLNHGGTRRPPNPPMAAKQKATGNG